MQDKNEEVLNALKRLGDECYKAKDYVRAIVYFQKYLDINPQNAHMQNIIGYMYRKLSKFENLDLQIKYHEKAVEIDPNYVCAIRNLAFLYQYVERYEDAKKCFEKIFELGPVTDDYMAYACLLIRLREFAAGWKLYEWRFNKEYGATEYPEIDKPRWQGEDISGKTLLIQYEQGFGDTIQFSRYVEIIKPLAKKIIFRVQNTLVDLIKSNFNDIEVVGMNTPLKELQFDYHTPLMSVLSVIKSNPDDIPLAQGYLKADKKKSKKYKKEFFDNDCLKIGISWCGMRMGNRTRNVLLKYFYPLTQLENVKIYSFQKSYGSEQLENLPNNIEIIDLGKTFDDFSDTAAAMDNVDIFVTSDNGIFNLAGAMGKKTYLLLSKYAEWRWFTDDKTTPWYESVRIFKKKTYEEDWSNVMSEVIQEIKSA